MGLDKPKSPISLSKLNNFILYIFILFLSNLKCFTLLSLSDVVTVVLMDPKDAQQELGVLFFFLGKKELGVQTRYLLTSFILDKLNPKNVCRNFANGCKSTLTASYYNFHVLLSTSYPFK